MKHVFLRAAALGTLAVCLGCPADEDGLNPPPVGSGPGSGPGTPWSSGTGGDSGGAEGGDPEIVPCALGMPGECETGEKCMPIGAPAPGWSTPWAVSTCRPISGVAKVGEPCLVAEGLSEGYDNCEAGSLCYSSDMEGKEGRCVEICADGQCDSGGTCVVDNGGAFPVCLEPCDPLAPDCDAGDGCLPSGHPDVFACHVLQQGDRSTEGCAAKNGCLPGRACVPVELAGEDPSYVEEALGYICAEMCSLQEPDVCSFGLS